MNLNEQHCPMCHRITPQYLLEVRGGVKVYRCVACGGAYDEVPNGNHENQITAHTIAAVLVLKQELADKIQRLICEFEGISRTTVEYVYIQRSERCSVGRGMESVIEEIDIKVTL